MGTDGKVDPAQLLFQLASAGERARKVIERVVADLSDLNVQEFNVLHAVVEGETPMSIGEIEEAAPLGTDAGRRVKDLQEKGYVDRQIDPEHELRRIVSPTSSGESVHDRVMTQLSDQLARGLEIFDDGEIALLTRLLTQL